MKYNIEYLKLSYRILQEDIDAIDFQFFSPDSSSAETLLTSNYLSQSWIAPFKVNGVTFPTAEHWMIYQKARLFEDQEIAAKVMSTKHPDDVKSLGRKITGFVEEVWDCHKYNIVLEGNYCKFLQNESLLNILLATKTAILAEASSTDEVWGIGLSMEDNRIRNPLLWPGQNLLGFALMEVRDLLIENYENEK
ncbi:NADAR family protein [Arachidicoccus ginsenosidivorans]|jgi:ribA/ribD-fused uncharacterized protein|uniref:NADAR family protein n=1 Tax=Arachidicoccus ginsenosidivorans TaxID=496057 RepID=A0A5B8VL35_9BACT|nr:NADAR family protein [Arachidicoccus ginsenosidivorans]QEC72304.1 NADAR family protein [Arachidicoccus ginsenosidivorans]